MATQNIRAENDLYNNFGLEMRTKEGGNQWSPTVVHKGLQQGLGGSVCGVNLLS